jgi:predicted amidophosphoribosyltransferase
VNIQILRGKWTTGWALDLHTVSSIPLAEGGFYTTRSEIGEMLYQLKYRGDKNQIEPLAQIAADFIRSRSLCISALIPVAPSNTARPFQPVIEVAKHISQKLRMPLDLRYIVKIKNTEELKSVEDPLRRRKLLTGAFKAKETYKGQGILLFDDLFRSGETLNAITETAINDGRVASVYVLCLTKTRTKR